MSYPNYHTKYPCALCEYQGTDGHVDRDGCALCGRLRGIWPQIWLKIRLWLAGWQSGEMWTDQERK